MTTTLKIIGFGLFLALVRCQLAFPADQFNEEAPQIILKLDDAYPEQDGVHPGWAQVFSWLNERGITATIGLIGGKDTLPNPIFEAWISKQAKLGHEVWNHGWCHCKPGDTLREFRGTSYAYQFDHLQRTQQYARERLELDLTTFGAPYNGIDTVTARALAAIPELTNWLYAKPEQAGEHYAFPRLAAVNIEYPVHQPDFEQFKVGYLANLDRPLLTIQGHPRSWLENGRMAEFQRIIEFLISEGTMFTTPERFAASHPPTSKSH